MEKINPYIHEEIDFRENIPLPPYLVNCAKLFADEQLNETAKRLVALRDFSDGFFNLGGLVCDGESVQSTQEHLETLFNKIKQLYNLSDGPYDTDNYSLRDYYFGLFAGALYGALDTMNYALLYNKREALLMDIKDKFFGNK